MATAAHRLPWLFAPAGLVWGWLVVTEQHVSGDRGRFSSRCAARVADHCLRTGHLVAPAAEPMLVDGRGRRVRLVRRRLRTCQQPDVALGAFAFSQWYGPLLAWALLAFPSGRLQSRRDRVLVVSIFALFAVRVAVTAVPPRTARRRRLWHTESFPADQRRPVVAGSRGRVRVDVPRLDCSRVVSWPPLGRSSRAGRRMLTPALVAAPVFAAAVGYQYAIGWNASIPAVTELRLLYVVWWLYAAVAVALAVGLTRLRRTRLEVIDVFAELGPSRRRRGSGQPSPVPSATPTSPCWLGRTQPAATSTKPGSRSPPRRCSQTGRSHASNAAASRWPCWSTTSPCWRTPASSTRSSRRCV